MRPLAEDFARWRDDPITQMVLKALKLAAEAQKAKWDAAAWGGAVVRGQDLEDLLRELRTRADAYNALEELTFERIADWLGIEDAE